MSAKAIDLARKSMSDEQAWRLQEVHELRSGRRCSGCGRRITIGIQFTSLDVTDDPIEINVAACNREDCDYAERARADATVMKMIEFAWMDELGPDAPPAQIIVERDERKKAASSESDEPS